MTTPRRQSSTCGRGLCSTAVVIHLRRSSQGEVCCCRKLARHIPVPVSIDLDRLTRVRPAASEGEAEVQAGEDCPYSGMLSSMPLTRQTVAVARRKSLRSFHEVVECI